jgi:chromosome segregation ATPase
MDSQTEQIIREGLSQAREALSEFRYAIKSVSESCDRNDKKLSNLDKEFDDLNDSNINIRGRLESLEESQKNMSADVRSIRNSIIGSLIVAVLIGMAGLAFTAIRTPQQSTTQSVNK